MHHTPDKSQDGNRSVGQPLNTGNIPEHLSAAQQPGKPRLAVFITHGMGQQVPFETIDSAVEGIREAAIRNGGAVGESILARTVQHGTLKTQRVEFNVRDACGRDIEIHVYEGYWAPITEGQVTLRDVMSFLFRAGVKGLWNALWPFRRWIFGRTVSFGRQYSAALQLLVTLGLVLGLVVLNFITIAVTGYRVFHSAGAWEFSSEILDALTSIAGLYVIVTLFFGAVLGVLVWCKKRVKSPSGSRIWQAATQFGQIVFWLWIAATAISTAIMLLLVTGCVSPQGFDVPCLGQLWKIIWVGLLGASWLVKKILTQYLGDVAAYIDAHSLDRFSDIRNRIKTRVFEQVQAIYADPQYEGIAMVGHSLGSVITYDTLNALLNHDALNGNTLNVVGRTRLLLTFGSPLDKTAFIFASQIRTPAGSSKTTDTREALAASLQPLIQSYLPYRAIPWVNVYSPRDPVSGSLGFYDDPKHPDYAQYRIKNIIDRDALIPLVAHTEYWKNATVFDNLFGGLCQDDHATGKGHVEQPPIP